MPLGLKSIPLEFVVLFSQLSQANGARSRYSPELYTQCTIEGCLSSTYISKASVNFLALTPLTADLLSEAVALDQQCLGGLWTLEGYQRELDSPNSDLLVLQPQTVLQPQQASPNPQSSLIGIACLWAILEEAHITVLAIAPQYQRQGLGQALLFALLASAQQRGLEWATLEVRVSNVRAIALYQKFGFQEVGKRRNYYQAGHQNEDALILWRKGLQHPEFTQTLKQWQEKIEERLRRSGWQLSSEMIKPLAD